MIRDLDLHCGNLHRLAKLLPSTMGKWPTLSSRTSTIGLTSCLLDDVGVAGGDGVLGGGVAADGRPSFFFWHFVH